MEKQGKRDYERERDKQILEEHNASLRGKVMEIEAELDALASNSNSPTYKIQAKLVKALLTPVPKFKQGILCLELPYSYVAREAYKELRGMVEGDTEVTFNFIGLPVPPDSDWGQPLDTSDTITGKVPTGTTITGQVPTGTTISLLSGEEDDLPPGHPARGWLNGV